MQNESILFCIDQVVICDPITLREKCPNAEFFLVRIFPHSVVSLRIQSECGKIRTRKNSESGHFSRSVTVKVFDTNSHNSLGVTMSQFIRSHQSQFIKHAQTALEPLSPFCWPCIYPITLPWTSYISHLVLTNNIQNQPVELFYKKSCSWKFCKIHRKTHVPESFF